MDKFNNKAEIIAPLREVVGVFTSEKDMQSAIDKLTTQGFNPAEISVLADQKKIIEKFGENKPIENLMDNKETPRTGYIQKENFGAAKGSIIGGLAYIGSLAAAGVVIAVGGPLSAIFTTAAIAGSTFATIGVVLGKLIGDHHADYIETQLANGGIIIWVKVESDENEKLAMDILTEYNGKYLHTHTLDQNQDQEILVNS